MEKKINQVEKQNSSLAKTLAEANEKLAKRNGMRNNGQNALAFSMPFGMNNMSMMNQQLQMQRQFNISAIPQVNSSGVFNNGQSTNFNPMASIGNSSGSSGATTFQSEMLKQMKALTEKIEQVEQKATTPCTCPQSAEKID